MNESAKKQIEKMVNNQEELGQKAMNLMQQTGKGNLQYVGYWGTAPYIVDENNDMYIGSGKLDSGLLGAIVDMEYESTATQYQKSMKQAKELRSATFIGKVKAPIESQCLFSMPEMNKLKSLKGLENIDTSSVWSIERMFENDIYLETIEGINNWDVSNLVVANDVFNRTAIDNIDLSGWNTKNLRNIEGMFKNSWLKVINVSGWNTHKVSEMSNLFSDNLSLRKIIGIESWDTSNVINMEYTFFNTYHLKRLNIKNWNVSHVFSFNGMFRGAGLEQIDLSGWKFGKSKEREFDGMFTQMLFIKNINLSSWDLNYAISTDRMFAGCKHLETIRISNWKSNHLESKEDDNFMFNSCFKLKYVG